MPFADRRDAGARLAAALGDLAGKEAVLLGMVRGGLPVAAQAAAGLSLPYAPLPVRKVGHPENPELAIGAVAAGGVRVLDPLAEALLPATAVANAVAKAEAELAAAGSRFATAVGGRLCVVVDDGLATGLTAVAGWQAALRLGAKEAVVAAPVASTAALARLSRAGAPARTLYATDHLGAVSRWYRRFEPPPAEELEALCSFRPAVARQLLFPARFPARLELPPFFWERGVVVAVGPRREVEAALWALAEEGVGAAGIPGEGRDGAVLCMAAVEALRRRRETAVVPLGLWGIGPCGEAVQVAATNLGCGVAAVAAPRLPEWLDLPLLPPAEGQQPAAVARWFKGRLTGTGSRPLC